MKEWFYDFFTTKSAFVRAFRVGGTLLGSAVMTGQVPWPAWTGVLIACIAAAITGKDTPSGLPQKTGTLPK